MAESVTAWLRYAEDSTESSLFRNGKVKSIRDEGGVTKNNVGMEPAPPVAIHVRNARLGVVMDGALPRTSGTFAAHGFELLSDPLHNSGLGEFDFNDNDRIIKEYYSTCERLVKEATGAERVVAFDHNIRTTDIGKAEKQRISGGNLMQGAAMIVHGDYTLTSAAQRLRDLGTPPKENDTMKSFIPDGQSLLSLSEVERALAPGGRWGIINVWRNISRHPVMKNPLAVCDAQSIKPDDLVTYEIHYVDRIGENYLAKHDPAHSWYYYPKMTRDEALILKQWDSAGPIARSVGKTSDTGDQTCTFSFHSAFKFSEEADAPERESIEIRCIVIWPSSSSVVASKL